MENVEKLLEALREREVPESIILLVHRGVFDVMEATKRLVEDHHGVPESQRIERWSPYSEGA